MNIPGGVTVDCIDLRLLRSKKSHPITDVRVSFMNRFFRPLPFANGFFCRGLRAASMINDGVMMLKASGIVDTDDLCAPIY